MVEIGWNIFIKKIALQSKNEACHSNYYIVKKITKEMRFLTM